jgi:hypothetical protein
MIRNSHSGSRRKCDYTSRPGLELVLQLCRETQDKEVYLPKKAWPETSMSFSYTRTLRPIWEAATPWGACQRVLLC